MKNAFYTPINMSYSSFKKQVLTGLALAAMIGTTYAQQLPLYSQYHAIPFLQNPSLTGNTDNMNISLIHKSMWKDIPGAPVTSALTIEGPIQEKNIGLGGILFNDVTDITQRIGFSTTYSYRLQINDNSRLMLGAGLGLIDTKIDYSRAVVKDVNDPLILQNNQHKTVFNADFGMTFIWKTLEIGIAVPQILANEVKMSTEQNSAYYMLARHYMFSAKYVFAINKDKSMTMYPLVMVRYAKNTPLQYDVNAVIDWEKRGWFAVTYRSNYAVGLNLGVHINKSLRAGYAYDLAIGNIASYAGGSHEIMLGYTFGKSENKQTTSDNSSTNTRQDFLTDSMMVVLKKENEANKQQITDLQKQLDEVKSKQNSGGGNSNTNNGGGNDQPKGPNPGANNTMSDTTGPMRPGNASDFVDEDGKLVIPNYYVVVGSFKNKEGANERKSDYLKRGFPMTTYIYNDKKKMYYTCVINTANEEAANRELADAKYGTPDAWVFILK